MKKLLLIFILITIVFGYLLTREEQQNKILNKVFTFTQPSRQTPTSNRTQEKVVILAENLDTPWGMVFLPNSEILFTERPGRIRLINKDGKLVEEPIATIFSVKEIGEGGLLGITIHPDYSQNHFVYLYYTYSQNSSNTLNRVVRMTLSDKKLINEKIIIDRIPGASNHNGGRIKFGPDKMLYVTTGDAQEPSQSQDRNSLAGKILRARDDGQTPTDNPFNNLVFSYGHRNPQGLAWYRNGRLWSTEHGRSGIRSGFDELNLIEKGKNYGWPTIEGDEEQTDMETSKKNSGNTTWAPAGSDFIDNSLFFAGLRGQALYEAIIDGDQVKEVKEHLKNQYGRIREVVKGPDNMLYISTSNQDGRGSPDDTDDKIIRINPQKL